MRLILRLGITFLLALTLGAIVLLVSGRSPVQIYTLLFQQSLGSLAALTDTLSIATPLIFTGVATGLAFQAGVFNMGVEGALYLGAFAAAWVGFTFITLPGWIIIILALLLAGITGGIFCLIPGYFRAYYRVDEVVVTLLLSYAAIDFTSYLVNYPFLAPGAANNRTPAIALQAHLYQFSASSQLNISLILALLTALVAAFFLYRTSLGYKFRAAGLNPAFATTMGFSVPRIITVAMTLSGLVGGIAGGCLVLGTQYRFIQGISPGYGWDGIVITLLAENNPLGAILGAVLIAALRVGGTNMQLFTNIPLELVQIIEAFVIILATVQKLLPVKTK